MVMSVNEGLCIGCSLCVVACPEEAITARGISVIDEKKCAECLTCIDNCPADAIEEENR